MKNNHLTASNGHPAGGISIAAVALATAFLSPLAESAVTTVNLGGATGFAVLAGSGITVAGPVNSTFITGDIGSYPTDSITGLENTVIDGVNHAGDPVTQAAKVDLTAAYLDAAGRDHTMQVADGFDLAGLTLTTGVYRSPSSLYLNGFLNLDAEGDPTAVWIFQAGSTFISGDGSQVNLIGGARPENIFWQVGSSATLGTDSEFAGSILALHSITLTTGATIDGRALAINGAVTMDNNTIVVPEPGSALLLCAGAVGTLAIRRRRTVRESSRH